MNAATQTTLKPIEILLIEDDEGDILLTKKALTSGKIFNSLSIAKNGLEALAFLRREGEHVNAPRPDLILLDLNMPRMDGRETLACLKEDESLRSIPVVVLTTSDADQDILQSYHLQASCYIAKPIDMAQFVDAVQAINDFWFTVVRLPPRR